MSLPVFPFDQLRRAAAYKIFWLGFPLLVYSWTAVLPFWFDDLVLIEKSARYERGESDQLGLFRFATTDGEFQDLKSRGTLPWWTAYTNRIDYFRPAAERIIHAEWKLFQSHPAGYRIANLVWFALGLISVNYLFFLVGQDKLRAGLATFLVGVSQTAALPVTWISNSTDLFVLVAVSLSAAAYWKTIRQGRAVFIVPALIAFAFALFCKEAAISLAFIVAGHELIRRFQPSAAYRRVTSFVGYGLLALALAYLVGYVSSRPWAMTMAGAGSGVGDLLYRYGTAILLNLSVWTIGFPVDLLLLGTEGQRLALAAFAAVVTLFVAYGLRRTVAADTGAPFFLMWAMFFMAPSLAIHTSARTLFLATVGWAYILSAAMLPAKSPRAAPSLALRHWLYVANITLGVGCGVGTVIVLNRAETKSRIAIQEAVSAQTPPLRAGDTLIIAEAPGSLGLVCAGDRVRYLTGLPDVGFSYLGLAGEGAAFSLEDAHTLFMTTKSSLLAAPIQYLALGQKQPLRVGRRFPLKSFTAEIAALDETDRVKAVRFRFDRPLSAPDLHFFPASLEAIAKSRPPVIPTARAGLNDDLEPPTP